MSRIIIVSVIVFLSLLVRHNFSDNQSFAQAVVVSPVAETVSFQTGSGDVADDSAIWVNTTNPSQSVIVADNKATSGGGIGVFDLEGKQIQFRPDGFIGNVDLRSSYQFGTRNIILVGGNHRGNSTIVLYELNPSNRQLTPIPGTRSTGNTNYGFCFYQSKPSGKVYAIVLHENGLLQQHELQVSGNNINTTVVRSTDVGGQSEGCVADDELGHLYVAEEDGGVWKYSAEPTGGTTRTRVDSATNGGVFVNDLEGMALVYGANGTGYIFVSRQDAANTEYAMYRREGNNQFVKTFKIGESGSIDAVADTDGIDAVFANLGPSFPKGLFVAHDSGNTGATSAVSSNLKYVPLERIVDMGSTGPTPSTSSGPTANPNGTRFALTLYLHGIGKAGDNSNVGSTGNLAPLTPQRTVSIEFFDAGNSLVKTSTGTVSFNTANGNFTGTINADTLSSGIYTLRVKTDKYLRRQIPGIITATAGQLTTITPIAMIVGDINNDNRLDIVDYNVILDCFSDLMPAKNCADPVKKMSSDITDDGNVNQFDYNLFLREISVQGSIIDPTPGGPQPTNQPTATTGPTQPPSVGGGSGVLLSQDELKAIPIAGQNGCTSGSLCFNAWNAIIAKANSNWGNPDIDTYDLPHEEGVLAAAIASARLGSEPGRTAESQTFYNKAVAGLLAVIGTEKESLPSSGGGKDDGSLAIARNFAEYVIASDLIGLYPDGNVNSSGTKWGNYVKYMQHQKFTFRVGDGGHDFTQGHPCASNGCAMTGASRIATAAYLKDKAELDAAWITFRRYVGDKTASTTIDFSNTGDTWYHNNNDKLAINPKNATCAGTGYPADGVIPNDQGRGSSCPSNASRAPTYGPGSQYPWEGLQGAYLQALLLDHLGYKDAAGKTPWQVADSALLRAVQYQYKLRTLPPNDPQWYDESRAAWVKHLANVKYGFKPLQYNVSGSGRNMDFTQWTHPR